MAMIGGVVYAIIGLTLGLTGLHYCNDLVVAEVTQVDELADGMCRVHVMYKAHDGVMYTADVQVACGSDDRLSGCYCHRSPYNFWAGSDDHMSYRACMAYIVSSAVISGVILVLCCCFVCSLPVCFKRYLLVRQDPVQEIGV
jgi:hypothetical protein